MPDLAESKLECSHTWTMERVARQARACTRSEKGFRSWALVAQRTSHFDGA